MDNQQEPQTPPLDGPTANEAEVDAALFDHDEEESTR